MSDLYFDSVSMEFVNKIDKRRNHRDWCVVLPNPFDNDRYAEEYTIPATGEKLRIVYSREEFNDSYVHNHIQATKALYYRYDLSEAILNYVCIPYEEYDVLTNATQNDMSVEDYKKLKEMVTKND